MSLGRLCGLSGTYFILLQFLLRARIQWLENAIGFMTIDRLHKKNGYLAISLLLAHPVLLTWGYAINGRKSLFAQIILFIFNYEDVFKALLGLILFIAVVATSIYIVRRKMPYHWWYFVHLVTYLAIILAFGHQLTNGEEFVSNPAFSVFWYLLYVIVFGSIFYWKIVRVGVMYYKHRFYVADVVKETADTVSLYIKGKNIDSIKYTAGQFAFVHILSKELWWDVHPFSISCVPNEKYIRFTIKASGDYTRRMPEVKINTPVVLVLHHCGRCYALLVKSMTLFWFTRIKLRPILFFASRLRNYQKKIIFPFFI